MDDIELAISGRFLGKNRPTGTHRSAKQLMLMVLKSKGSACRVYAPKGSNFEAHGAARVDLHASDGATAHLWEQTLFPQTSRCKTILTLMGSGPVLHPGKKHVMVVHDLNYAILPHVYSRAFRTWYRFACGAAAQRADIVVCFTHYVSATLQSRLGIPIDRIKVIPQGPGLFGLDKPLKVPRSEASERPYFLCVGSLQPHKNLSGVLAAWETFRQRNGDYLLKIVGRAQGNFTSLGVDLSRLSPDVEFTGYISDEELIDLYRGAKGFLYPSIEEGFGLPVIEAFYCGCPVITSNRSCLPEVAGNAAILVEPNDVRGIAAAMVLLADNPRKGSDLRSKGFNRTQIYNWEKAGKAIVGILDEVVHKV